MNKIDPVLLSKKIEDILNEAQRESRIPEKLIEAIKEMDKNVLSFRRYSFICPECKKDTYIEEVLDEVTKISMVESIEIIEDRGRPHFVIDYGHEETKDGNYDGAIYRCHACHLSLTYSILSQISKQDNIMQEGMIPVFVSKTEYGHKIMVPGNLTDKEIHKYLENLIKNGEVPGFNEDTEWWIDK